MTFRNQRDAIFLAAPGLETTELLFDTINDILFCAKDRQRRYIAANEAFLHLAGVRNRTELIGRTASELFPAILAAGFEQDDDTVFTQDLPVRDRLEMITQPDGSVGWFVSQKVGVKSTAGETIALVGISRAIEYWPQRGEELGSLAAILETVHRDCGEPLRIEALAKQAGLSPSQFQRRVRRIAGLTPRQLLTKARIDRAAHQLRTTDEPLAAIARDCGFYDHAAFSRQFCGATGLTPGEYRREFRRHKTG